MELPLLWAFVILIVIIILYKISLRQLHNKLKPIVHDDGVYSDEEVKKNGKYWDDNFGDMDKFANYAIGACVLLGVYFSGYVGGAASAAAPAKVGGSPIVQYA